MTRDKKDCYWVRRENDSSWPKIFRFSVLLKIFRFSVLLKCWKFFGNRKIFGFFGLRRDEWRRIDAETGFSPSFSVLPNRCWTESVPLLQRKAGLLCQDFFELNWADRCVVCGLWMLNTDVQICQLFVLAVSELFWNQQRLTFWDFLRFDSFLISKKLLALNIICK